MRRQRSEPHGLSVLVQHAGAVTQMANHLYICRFAAAELPVRGLILSSLPPALLPLANQMRYPILVTDGLGSLPMNSLAYRLLSTNVQREVTLNAEAYDRYSGGRPEAIIALPVSQEPAAPRSERGHSG